MRRTSEHGHEPQEGWRAWLIAIACAAITSLAPGLALAEEPAAEAEAATDAATASVEVDGEVSEEMDEEVSEEELAAARAQIDAAQSQLDEARRQLDMRDAVDPKPEPGSGIGLVASDGRAKKIQVSLNDDGTLYLRFAAWLQVWTRAIQNNPGTTV
ncbi:MAG: hypothetical protein ACN4G0_16660, partial [Polyangiales bacterium]